MCLKFIALLSLDNLPYTSKTIRYSGLLMRIYRPIYLHKLIHCHVAYIKPLKYILDLTWIQIRQCYWHWSTLLYTHY
jgi:hypothetical protein